MSYFCTGGDLKDSKTSSHFLFSFAPVFSVTFFGFEVFPVETAKGAEHLWFPITLGELQRGTVAWNYRCFKTR